MILSSDEAILERWAQNFKEVLNGDTFERAGSKTMVKNQGHLEMEEPLPI
jgi:hypothetical protein